VAAGKRVARLRIIDYGLAEMTNNQRFMPNPPRRIEILAFAMAQLLDVAGLLQVFAAARIKRIALRGRFGSKETMRCGFLRIVRITPQDSGIAFRAESALPPCLQAQAY
jgi:hypothetical protein